jgi:transmembrane sensor
MSAGIAGPAQAAALHADSWTRGILRVRDMRLQDFAAELARYRPGILHCDPAVAELRISGAFQLGDTTPVLDSLPKALPVEVLYRSRYWVTLVAPGS